MAGVSTADEEIYSKLEAHILTEVQLQKNSYPRPTSQPGAAIIHNIPDKCQDTGEKKICKNCEGFFTVKSLEDYPEDECVYHYGKCWNYIDGVRYSTPRYTCCMKGEGSSGCSRHPYHVHSSNTYKADHGYVTTKPRESLDSNLSIFSLDCEMVYTKGGQELARVTLLNYKKERIYETMVKPSYPILDYATRFSGLTEKDFKGVSTTLEDVQTKLLGLINNKTILIGHGLQHDLHNLRIIHSYIIDTTVTFPHKKGHPYKKSLKNLASQNLGRNIQNGKHDSGEDASTCMDLMLQKIGKSGKHHLCL